MYCHHQKCFYQEENTFVKQKVGVEESATICISRALLFMGHLDKLKRAYRCGAGEG